MFLFKSKPDNIKENIKSLKDKYEDEVEHLKKIYFDEIIQIGDYSGINKKKILKIKLYHKKDELNSFLNHMKKALISLDNIVKLDSKKTIISYVPINLFQYIYRGFSHTYISAEILSKVSGISNKKIFHKKLSLKKQSSLSREDRHLNLQNRFYLRKNLNIKGKDIILVDDIVASGVTVNVLSKILKQAGANRVYIIVLAGSTWKSL